VRRQRARHAGGIRGVFSWAPSWAASTS
jgi:hypothetical protein